MAVTCLSVFVVPTTGCGSKGNGFADGGGDDSGDPCIEFGNCDDAELSTDSGTTQGDSLTVTPQGVQLTAMGSPVTQQYTALFTSTMMQDPNAAWSLDNVALGTIDSTGLFKAFGNVGGVATIDADDQQANAKGSTTVTVSVVLTENPGNVHLCLAVADTRAAWERAVGCGARPIVPEGPVGVDAGPNKGARVAYLRIHDGITLEFFQRPQP